MADEQISVQQRAALEKDVQKLVAKLNKLEDGLRGQLALDVLRVINEQTVPRAATPAPAEHIMQFFAYGHLPAELAAISRSFFMTAVWIVDTLPRNPERTVALRKLLEAKDAAVRAHIAKEPPRTVPA